jgi:diphthamide synthase (EF-2-diphthine--ammonia ligase)
LTFRPRYVLVLFVNTAPPNRTEERQLRLARLEALACSLAERAHERAMAAEAEADFQSASKSFERLGRAARQCMALSARLEREAAQEARDQAKAQARELEAETVDRVRRATGRAVRLIWTEAEGREAEDLESDLNERLEREIEAGALETETIEELVQRLCTDLGLGRVHAQVHRTAPHAEAGSQPALPHQWNSG